MTKEQWAEVEKRATAPWGYAKLDCDGYIISIRRERYSGLRDCLVVYVGGVWKGEWAKEDCEERRRFFCPKKKYFHTAKGRAQMQAHRAKLTKREIEWLKSQFKDSAIFDIDACFTYYLPIWPSWKPLKAHLVRNNKEISIVRDAGESPEPGCRLAESPPAGAVL